MRYIHSMRPAFAAALLVFVGLTFPRKLELGEFELRLFKFSRHGPECPDSVPGFHGTTVKVYAHPDR